MRHCTPEDLGLAALREPLADDAEQGLGAMAALRGAAPGDEVVVTGTDGAATRWRVVSRELLDKQALPVDVLFRRDGPPRLTLVTCGGPFLPDLGGHRGNVGVVAEPAPRRVSSSPGPPGGGRGSGR